jgi:hypothetical protein
MTNYSREKFPDTYHVSPISQEIRAGTVSMEASSALSAVHSVKQSRHSRTIRTEYPHPSGVFTISEFARIAQDLLPEVADGEERLLTEVLKDVLDDRTNALELKIRLGAEALTRFAGTTPTPRQLGLRTKEELNGTAHQSGSNIWKINEMLDGFQAGRYPLGSYNELNLAIPSKRDLDMMPERDTDDVRAQIDAVNRAALDELYEQNYVNFTQATVWERSEGAYTSRRTIYPTQGESFHFVEELITPVDMTPTTTAPMFARVVLGSPQPPSELGYSPAI